MQEIIYPWGKLIGVDIGIKNALHVTRVIGFGGHGSLGTYER